MLDWDDKINTKRASVVPPNRKAWMYPIIIHTVRALNYIYIYESVKMLPADYHTREVGEMRIRFPSEFTEVWGL